MTTLSTLAEEIAQILGVDDPIMIASLRLRALHFRQLLLKREYEKTRRFNPSTVVAFNVTSQEVERYGSKAFLSPEIPQQLLVDVLSPFISVGNTMLDGGRKIYGYVRPEEVEFIPYRRFGKIADLYTVENNRIVSFNKSVLRIRYVPESPLDVLKFAKESDLTTTCGASLEGNCFDKNDIVLEETLAAAILSMFGQNTSRRNVSPDNPVQQEA